VNLRGNRQTKSAIQHAYDIGIDRYRVGFPGHRKERVRRIATDVGEARQALWVRGRLSVPCSERPT